MEAEKFHFWIIEMKCFYGTNVLFLFSCLGCSHFQSAVPVISESTMNPFFGFFWFVWLFFFPFFLSYSRLENYSKLMERCPEGLCRLWWRKAACGLSSSSAVNSIVDFKASELWQLRKNAVVKADIQGRHMNESRSKESELGLHLDSWLCLKITGWGTKKQNKLWPPPWTEQWWLCKETCKLLAAQTSFCQQAPYQGDDFRCWRQITSNACTKRSISFLSLPLNIYFPVVFVSNSPAFYFSSNIILGRGETIPWKGKFQRPDISFLFLFFFLTAEKNTIKTVREVVRTCFQNLW